MSVDSASTEENGGGRRNQRRRVGVVVVHPLSLTFPRILCAVMKLQTTPDKPLQRLLWLCSAKYVPSLASSSQRSFPFSTDELTRSLFSTLTHRPPSSSPPGFLRPTPTLPPKLPSSDLNPSPRSQPSKSFEPPASLDPLLATCTEPSAPTTMFPDLVWRREQMES